MNHGDFVLMQTKEIIMKRRTFVMLCGGISAGLLTAGLQRRGSVIVGNSDGFVGPPAPPLSQMQRQFVPAYQARITDLHPDELVVISPDPPLSQLEEQSVPDYQTQIADLHPDESVVDNIAAAPLPGTRKPAAEIILGQDQLKMLKQVLARLARLQATVGYGNFNIISWDQSLRIARAYDNVGEFTRAELDFAEELFFTDADSLNFYGDKVVTQLSASIAKRDIQKIPATGHYLFRGDAIKTYQKIRQDIGDSIVLTSGIRSVVKQIYLFLNKAVQVDGNLSLASYSLAPPGHSYHAIGDFDVGKKNFGKKNFTQEFANTDEFKYLSDLGYIDIRYPQNNPYGVRYEPWHIKTI